MAERFKAAVLKTVEAKVSVGSNPTLSEVVWSGAREAEGSSLLNCRTGFRTEGSNPSHSELLRMSPCQIASERSRRA